MKICYDNLEGIKLTSNGIFLKNNRDSYIYKDTCKGCGESYLTLKHRQSLFCCKSCAFVGKIFSKEHCKNISKGKTGKATKHGAYLLGLASYDTYASRLWCDEVDFEYIGNSKILKVKCVSCNEFFIPSARSVINRVRYLEDKITCESRFYCSDRCRIVCPVFGQHKYPKGFTYKRSYTSSEYKTWKEEVIKRAGYLCEYCGEKATQAHHIQPKKLEPFFALDPDNGIACCKRCHYKYGHRDECSSKNISKSLLCI